MTTNNIRQLVKDITGEDIEDIMGNDWENNIEDRIGDMETNTCDKCDESMPSIELNWITAEDFRLFYGETLSDESYKLYDALCEKCYNSELI